MALGLKKFLGLSLWYATHAFPRARTIISPLGLRTSREWYSGKRSNVLFANNEVVELSGIESNYLTFQLHWSGWSYYEPVTMLLFRELLQDAEMFIDIGANIGYYSLFAATERPKIDITAFEPNPKIFDILRKNVRANDFNIICENSAVSDHTGVEELYLAASDMSASLELRFRQGEHIGRVKTRTITLDAYMENRLSEKNTLIKLDTEGHEESNLKGMHAILHRGNPEIIVEVLSEFEEATHAVLKDCGYHFYQITPTGFLSSDRLIRIPGKYESYNYLLTPRRDAEEMKHIFERISSRIEAIDLARTSLARI